MATRGARLCVLPYAVSDGAANMAMDEAMIEMARRGWTLIRLYGWEPWCLSLGRNQAAPARLLCSEAEEIRVGVDVVRRPTGGRSVYHGPEITYAVSCPDRAWGGPRSLYLRVHRAVAIGLERSGVDLDIEQTGAPTGSRPGRARGPGSGVELAPTDAACFRDPAPGELTVRGRKLVGSAQCRRSGALLQHGSILLSNLQDRSELGDAGPTSAEPPGIGLDEALGGPVDAPRIVARLTAALEAALGPGEPRAGGVSKDAAAPPETTPGRVVLDELRFCAARLEPRYRSAEWLGRRRATSPVGAG